VRSAERCKEHYQGDRCREPRGHSSPLALSPDPQHAGQFNVWTGDGDSKKLLRGTENRFKRSRFFNRAFRRVACDKKENLALVETKEAPLRKRLLEAIFNHFNQK